MKNLFYKLGFILYYTKLYRIIIYLRQYAPKILVYHNIGKENPFIKGLNISISIDAFKKQMSFLNKHYNVVSLRSLLADLEKKNKSARIVAITFDDGYKNFINNVHPILQSYKYHATIFLVKKCVIDNSYMWVNSLCYMKHSNEASAIESNSFKGSINENNSFNKYRLLGKLSKDACMTLDTKKIEKYASNLDEGIEAPASDLYLTQEDCRFLSQYNVDFGNHSLSHFDFSCLGKHEIKKEISMWNMQIKGINFKHHWLALPFGSPLRNQEEIEVILQNTDIKYVFYSNGLDNDHDISMFKLGRHHLTSYKEYRIFTEMELLPFFRRIYNKIKNFTSFAINLKKNEIV